MSVMFQNARRIIGKTKLRQIVLTLAAVTIPLLVLSAGRAQNSKKKYKVTIKDEKTQVKEVILPVDPTIRIRLNTSSGMGYGLQTIDGKRLTFSTGSARTLLKMDGVRVYPNGNRMPLPPRKGKKKARVGWMYKFQRGNIHVTQTQEVVPSKLPGRTKPGQKRKMDAVLIKYVVENKGNKDAKFALRVRIDMYNWTTDGPAFWAPTTMPGKILDGVVITGKKIPEYIISIQNRNLKNPGHLAYFTFNQGKSWEMPEKVIPTSHGAQDRGWEVQATPNQFDTDIVLYWAEKTLKPGEKRVIVYGYGTGIATSPENEGRVTTVVSGSFEPKKIFTVTAYVDDPVESQYLTLMLPKGMQLLEGSQTQPVPQPNEDNRSVVIWKGRVAEPGDFTFLVKSSNGITHSKVVSVEKN